MIKIYKLNIVKEVDEKDLPYWREKGFMKVGETKTTAKSNNDKELKAKIAELEKALAEKDTKIAELEKALAEISAQAR